MSHAVAHPTDVPNVLAGLKVCDVDSHITEPHNLWTSRVSKKWGDQIPHAIVDPATGKESWFIGDECYFGDPEGMLLVTGADELTRAGGSDPQERLKWMDIHNVYAQVLFPNHIAFFVSAFLKMEPALRSECVRAYNDFQTEFASVDPKRLLPMANLPWWDVEEAVAEVQRCHAMGHKGVNLGWEFDKIGFPRLRDPHWTPLLKTIEELGLPVNFHVGFNSAQVKVDEILAATELDKAAWAALFFAGNQQCITELIVGRICHNYPGIKFVSVESGVGFVPYLLEALDWQFQNRNLRAEYPDMVLPSEYFRRQIYGTFWFETDVPRLVDLYPDNFMFESDFPHSTSLTPSASQEFVVGPYETIVTNLGSMSTEHLRKVVQDNAVGVYGIDLS